jgi:predicted nucleic acid-binding protein
MVIIDTDILSMFAKAHEIDLLIKLLGKDQIGMTSAIADEISIPLQYGYDFPLQVLSQIPVVPISSAVGEEFVRLQTSVESLGRGEREAMAFCRINAAIFATNDAVAREFALTQGIKVISLQALLRGLWVSGLRSKGETQELLERIKHADYLKVSEEVENEIFGQNEEELLDEP